MSDSEEDPFHTENDEDDPSYSPEKSKRKKVYTQIETKDLNKDHFFEKEKQIKQGGVSSNDNVNGPQSNLMEYVDSNIDERTVKTTNTDQLMEILAIVKNVQKQITRIDINQYSDRNLNLININST